MKLINSLQFPHRPFLMEMDNITSRSFRFFGVYLHWVRFEYYNKMAKNDQYEDQKKRGKQQNLLQRVREFLFRRNYQLVASLKLRFFEAIFFIIIEQLQKIAIITRYSVNPTLLGSPEMYYIDSISRILLLDFFSAADNQNFIITVVLILGQLLIILVIVLPMKGEILNEIVSKYILTLLEMILTLPSIILSISFVIHGVNVGPNVVLYIMTITTNLIFVSMQMECSFERENFNMYVRIARPITPKIVNLVLVSIFPILSYFMFPTSSACYSFMMLVFEALSWYYYLHKLIYFHELIMYVKGFMLTINISSNICYLTIYVMNSAIISQNILLFITTFSIFLGNFFITYRKYLLENIIINKDLKGENEIGLYCIFYWHCYTHITQKKNQLYISSLLKNHTNQCLELTCCCKNRQYLYDTQLKVFGNPNIQPHFDNIFIRHFIRKLLCDGYERFSKSSIIVLLLSNYNIETVEMVTQTMVLIKKLSKMQQKKKLNLPEQFLLFSLKQKTRNKIKNTNFTRGHVDLQKVKEFDERLITLNESLRSSVQIYHSLWKQLQNTKLKEAVLYDICKSNLELMFSIQKTYKFLKGINTESSELRALMLFYSRLILHDIHLLSEVKKEIKLSQQRNVVLSTFELNNIHLFGHNTVTIISLDNNRIKWASKNAYRIFEYNKNQFHNLTVKNLMPRHFAERHDSYIERWKSTGHDIKLNKTNYLWGSTKSGTCFSLLIFVKVIPLPHEQDYAFFSSMEKLDDQQQLICSQFGEVYGAGKHFSKITNMNPKFLQEIKMNIQIFIPYTFEYFLEYFYPKNAKLKAIKRNFEVRREGYFPENLDLILRWLQQQRNLFLKKHERGEKFAKEYIDFIRQKMQELTCNINGEYVSISIMPYKTATFQRQSERVIVLKISDSKKNSIDKYYTQLEKTLSKLQNLCHEENTKESKIMPKKNKNDFFKVFLNPKRMKRLLQNQQNETNKHQQGQAITHQASLTKSNQLRNLFAHRKQLALGAKIQIKSDRVRYNLFKMKKILLQQGIISRYTYNILIGKKFMNNFRSEPNIEQQDANELNKSLMNVDDDKIVSEEENVSINHDSDGELAANKENDIETFNSGSSSATFISMTNHVKMFKIKLRSLNTPKLLLLLNIVILAVLAIGTISLISLTYSNINNLSIGVKEFQNNQEANLILDSLFLGQSNIKNLNAEPSNIHYNAQRAYFVNSVSHYYQKQMFLRAQYKQIDPKILNYLALIIIDTETLTVAEFIELIMNQILTNQYSHVMKYYLLSMQEIATYSSSNIYFNRINTLIFYSFLLFLLSTIALLILTLPIIYKLKIKIKEIYDLLNRISPNEKSKYFKHFTFLNDEFKKKEEIQYSDLNNFIITYENRSKQKQMKSNTKSVFSEDSIAKNNRKLSKKQKVSETIEEETMISTDQIVYFEIAAIYLILFAAVIFNYTFVKIYHHVFMNANDQFIALFNAKTLLTSRIVEGQYELMGYPHETNYNSTSIEFVNILYSTYSIQGISQHYKDYIFNFVTGKPCSFISHLLTQEQLSFCSTLNNHTFEEGGTDNLYYSQRKMEEQVNDYYSARSYMQNNEQNIIYAPYFLTEDYFELIIGYFYSTLMIYDLYAQVNREMSSFASSYELQLSISLFVCLSLILLFLTLWLWIYSKLAEDASYINAFLLLIPFDVLSENPYIKLYIKNQFDYKASY